MSFKGNLPTQKQACILCIFFWVFPRRQIVVGRRFGTLYQFHLQRLGVQYTQPLKMELIQGSKTSANYNLTPGKYPKENIHTSTAMLPSSFKKSYIHVSHVDVHSVVGGYILPIPKDGLHGPDHVGGIL